MFYKLVNKIPVKCSSLDVNMWDIDNRRVAYTEINKVTISTVFLFFNHNYLGGKPLFFETMVFGGIFDGEIHRYNTWNDAALGHMAIVQKVNDLMFTLNISSVKDKETT